jgi:hypothetical protein
MGDSNGIFKSFQETCMKDTHKPVREPRIPAGTLLTAKPAATKGKTAVREKGIQPPVPAATRPTLGEDREQRIRVAAYLRAERRGFVPGREFEDWLAAEAEVDATAALRQGRAAAGSARPH